MTDDNKIVSIARYAAPGHEEVAKFAEGRQTSFGRQGSLLSRTIGRYASTIRSRIEEAVSILEAEFQIDIPYDMSPTSDRYLREQDSNVLHLQISTVIEHRTLPSRVAVVARTIAAEGAGVMQEGFANAWERLFGDRHNLVLNRAGTDQPMVVHIIGRPEIRAADAVMPTRRFMSLAEASMTAELGDLESAQANLDALAREYHYRTATGEGSRIDLFGVELSTFDGAHSISVATPDGPKQIAVERNGLFLEVDAEACAALRGHTPEAPSITA